MENIECLVCGKSLTLPKYIDTERYDGQVVCQECDSLLYIALADSKVRKYRIIKMKFKPPTIIEIIKDTKQPTAKSRSKQEEA